MQFDSRHARTIWLWGVLLAAVLSIWPTWRPLAGTWHDMADYAHSPYVVLFLTGWLALRSLDLPPLAPRELPFALAALLGALVGWLVAFKASSAIGEQIMAPVILWCAVWSAFGRQVAMRVATPIFCIYFAIPVWELALPWLQRTTIAVSETMLGWLGVPVHIDGVLVNIPEGTFKIAEGCSGKNFFVVALAVGVMCATTARLRSWRAVGFMATTALLALVMNWVRVVIVIYAGHVTNMTSYLVAREHITFGWALFAVLVLFIGWLARFLRDGRLAPAAGNSLPEATHQPYSARLMPALWATVALLCIPLAAVEHVRANQPRFAQAGALALPSSVSNAWVGPGEPDASWSPHFLGAARIARGAYHGALGDVEVFIAEYGTEQPGSKLVSFENTLIAKSWTSVTVNPLGESLRLSGAPYRIKTLRAETPMGKRWVISYLYQVGALVTSSPVMAQLAYGILSWTGNVPTRFIAAAAPCEGSCDGAQTRLEGFWRVLGPRMLHLP